MWSKKPLTKAPIRFFCSPKSMDAKKNFTEEN